MGDKGTNRIEEIDIAKGICILLMVIGHSGMKNMIHDFIYAFHMPSVPPISLTTLSCVTGLAGTTILKSRNVEFIETILLLIDRASRFN